MADLNADLILQGVDTTHPVMAIDEGTQLQRAADTVNTQAGTQQTKASTNLTNLQAQGVALQNQQAQIQMQGAQQYAKALAQVSARIRSGQQAPTTPAATDTSSPAPAANTAAGAPSSTPTGSTGTSGNPPGTTNVLPAGVDPTWKVNAATDWYTDADGNPISHYTGPALAPSGRVNMHSAQIQDEIADTMAKNGGNPAFIAQMRLSGEQKAQDLDKANISLYQDMQKSQEAKQAAALSDQKIQKDVRDHVANMADFDLQQPNPQAAFLQSVGQNPKMWDSIMSQAAGPGQKPITDPNDPRILPILKGLQSQSPAYIERQKAAAEGIHILPGVFDPNTGTTSQGTAFKVDSTGKVVKLIGGQVPGGGSTSTAPGGPPAKTPLQAEIDAVGTYATPITNVPAKMKQFVQQGLSQQYPEYDAAQFNAKNKALTDYTSGQDHKTVVAIQTAYNHLDQLKVATQALNSGNTPLFNQVSQAYQKATGSAIPTDAAAIKLVALDEVSKALTGAAGGEGDRTAAQNIVNLAGSPSQVSEAIDKLSGLMQGKVGPLQDSATAAGLTDKQQRAIFGNLYQVPGANGRVSGNDTSKTPPAAKVPTKTGDLVTDSKGQTYAYKGSGDVKDIKNYVLVK